MSRSGPNSRMPDRCDEMIMTIIVQLLEIDIN